MSVRGGELRLNRIATLWLQGFSSGTELCEAESGQIFGRPAPPDFGAAFAARIAVPVGAARPADPQHAAACQVELPAVPECVAAARRAELQRRHHRLLKEAQPDTCDERRATGPGVALDAQLGVGSLPVRPGSAWLPPLGQSAEAPACPNGEDTESQVEEEMPRARTWDLPRTGAATRPRSQSYDDISDLDSCSELVEFGVGEAVQSAQEVNRIE